MNVGDLVKHKGFGNTYIVAELSDTAVGLIGILTDGEVRWISRNWIEVISHAKTKSKKQRPAIKKN